MIFHDTSAVDQILGNADSKFIKTKDGHHQLEVKRAISSSVPSVSNVSAR